MSNELQLHLIQTYSWVCDMYDKNQQWRYIRLSNNNQPAGRIVNALFWKISNGGGKFCILTRHSHKLLIK